MSKPLLTSAQQFRQLRHVRRDPPRLVFSEQLAAEPVSSFVNFTTVATKSGPKELKSALRELARRSYKSV